MAYATIDFHHPQTGRLKQAPVGFSWTTLLFGFFPALIRGHYVGAIIMVVIAFFTMGLSSLVFAFIYNKMYVKHLLGEGFKVSGATADVSHLSQQLRMTLPLDSARPSAMAA
ncbi:hypothetical protein KTN05_13805 [Paracoccus sp. Z118]|uniref:hypothetical protein n=1 Tax=Paracoccus sp. Z118 TaxID=2851017 RepID=UPI001C2BC965|nr:hypothetical protein [Paracoccus sp. Z118]MBV0892918.1 hypothetical protein [Paracoccus sp. Z118]